MSSIWAGAEPFFLPGSRIGCLLIHGLTSTPQEMRGLGEYLSESGHTVLGMRLPGHGTHPSDLSRLAWTDWYAEVEGRLGDLAKRCDDLFALGLSLGGALALLLAARGRVSGALAMSTPYRIPPYPALYALDWMSGISQHVAKLIPFIPKPPPLDYKDPEAARAHQAYRVYPMACVAEASKLLAEMRQELQNISVPVLLLHARDDRGVPSANARRIYQRLGTIEKRLDWIENSGHVMTLEPSKQIVFQQARDFVDKVSLQRKNAPA
jgi:carboxylesterase